MVARGRAAAQTPSQNAAPGSPAPASPATAGAAQQRWLPSQGAEATAAHAMAATPAVRYFSLEHRTQDQMDPQDRELLRSRNRELTTAAAIFGYDLSASGWNLDQAICPALPGALLLHYRSLGPAGSESLFTAVVPRDAGRVRVVPSLHSNASTFLPAVRDSRNYQLFRELVPASAAQQGVTLEGDWLPLAVCYAELVGARPNVPDDPGLDIAMLHAPSATIHIDEEAKTKQIQFPDREGAGNYVVWTVAFDKSGRIVKADAEDYATFVAHVITLPEPAGSTRPVPPEAIATISTPTEQPKSIISNPPNTAPHPPRPDDQVAPAPQRP